MQRKSPRGIPDFSRQATRAKDATRPDAAAPTKSTVRPAAPPKTPQIKPQGTSAKSSGRGK